MKHLNLIDEFRTLLAQLRREVESASAMQLYDTHKVAEQVICGVMRELYGFTGLRNLNAEHGNFPGIDLADDVGRIAVQVTATPDLPKIKDTLKTFLKHGLHERYDRLIVYILTVKQDGYSQSAIDAITNGYFSFSADTDIVDYRDLCGRVPFASPAQLQAAINVLKTYLRGIPVGLADEDIDPPAEPSEVLIGNLVELYFPNVIYVAQVANEIMEKHRKGRSRNLRQTVGEFCRQAMTPVPSTYVTYNDILITFFDLNTADHPYRSVIEEGTAEKISAREFWGIDENHERVFKSLLRFSLQHRLYSERVAWYNDEKLFVFLPRNADDDVREEMWQGNRHSTRKVFERKYGEKNTSIVLMQKHLAFSVDFHRLASDWLMSITPTWFFSYGKDFKKSGYGNINLGWLKRKENNRAVLNHFRFLVEWLKSIDTDDLFSERGKRDSFLSFGDCVALKGAPFLDETLWEPLPDESEHDDPPSIQKLFG
ncbi:SMEK domain-containing protein [Methylocaldum szegediense]|uniref:SMEK domain-containing protein n=1 Tax=Methylocaldum szegediense TaxID=73780 RepID=A0ABM9I6Q1_9GAMM|nr:SMEK domain-containing protein [Methylocaldum szegediense]CAI8928349.1 conserved protein of unknown function [Methylocaldum szegediense]